jgi:NTE family protein
LHVVAVDVISGEELRLSNGPVLDAVLASAAIPGVVAPVRWKDRTLMDGGVANNTPISHAVELGAERIYVLPTGHACALPEPPRGALAVALHAISLLTQRRLVDDIERHEDAARLIVLPPPCPLGIQPIDFGHADELIGRALADAREFLDDGGEHHPPIHMRMHPHADAQRRSKVPVSG